MNKILKHRIILCAAFVAATVMTGCSDWTEQESIDINKPDIETQNPELYAKYLENLIRYKNDDHNPIYGWFDNSTKDYFSRAQHIKNVSDSVDMISLLSPDGLTPTELSEIEMVRTKGTKVVYTIGYSTIEDEYAAYVEAEKEKLPKPEEGEEAPELVVESFVDFMAKSMASKLALADKYKYDGIAVWYNSKSLVHMTESEIAEYTANETAFFAPINEWIASHADKAVVFEGTPQYLLDKTILAKAKYIVLRTLSATAIYDLEYAVRMADVEGVPTDKILVSVHAIPTDESDIKTGRFFDADGNMASAILEAGYAIGNHSSRLNNVGLGIYNIQDDFYDKGLVYKNTRVAISVMNR